ncbi:hypothetical protein OSTOST_19884, partial [Ostertagia ostertagi]
MARFASEMPQKASKRGGGQSAVLCVKTGWYPSSGLGYCVKRNDSFLNAGSVKAASSASLECAALGGISDGQLIYSTLAIAEFQVDFCKERVLPWFAILDSMCSARLTLIASVADGVENWVYASRTWKPICPPLSSKFPARITYNSLPPYMPSATATLTCDLGLAASGVSTLTCTEEGWSPSVGFGECRTVSSGLKLADWHWLNLFSR